HRVDGGDIRWEGRSIAGLPPHRIARLGIGRTFQIVRPFGSMTVRENAAVGALFGSSAARRRLKEAFEVADQVLELVGLKAEGEPEVVLRDERVIKAYLGERYAKRLRGERGQDSAS